MDYYIFDLHCDLLLFLAGDQQRTPYHAQSRASIPQMLTGGVRTQILPVYTETEKKSAKKGMEQFAIFQTLATRYPVFRQLKEINTDKDTIGILLAIENASSICEEGESLQLAFERLEEMQSKTEKIVYISLTWNSENRFGGGALTSIGLKEDGKRLLDFLHNKKIAIDLSHTSDRLAHEIFDHIDRYRLNIPLMASHSNFRRVCAVPRNLPDEIAKEIFRRGGVVGVNFICSMVGPDPERDLVKQMEHALSLGGEKHVCFGADFFYEEDIALNIRKPVSEYFYPQYGNASVYGKVLNLYEKHLGLSPKILEGIAFENAATFILNSD